jgi:4-amino-4-deoxychorismate lyase
LVVDWSQIRFWLSTGPGDFGFLPDGCIEPCFYVMVFKGIPIDKNLELQGVSEYTVTGVPMKPPALAIIKSNNYLLNCLTAMESKDKGGRFGILLGDDGLIAESCVLNVAFVTPDNVFITPSFKKILAGVTIQKVLELAQKMVKEGKLRKVEQRDIRYEEARTAKEMFLLGGDTHLIPVVNWDDVPVGTGEVGPLFKDLLAQLEKDKLLGFKDHQAVRYVH